MIDQLLKIIQQNTQDTVTKNTEIPNKYNEGVQKEIFSSIQGGITSAISSGNISGVMDLFSKGAKKQSLSKNPIVKSISKNLVVNLAQKFGLSKKVSTSIANTVLPLVLQKFSQLVADPKDKSIDMNSVIGSLTGNKILGNTDFNDILGQFVQGKSGSMDLGNIASHLLSGSNGKGNSKGGLLGKLKGLFN